MKKPSTAFATALRMAIYNRYGKSRGCFKAFAYETGFIPQVVSMWINGYRHPTLADLITMSEVLDVSIHLLVTGKHFSPERERREKRELSMNCPAPQVALTERLRVSARD